MSAGQLKGLPKDLIKIGSHSVTHHVLPELAQEQALFELCESKRLLETITGRKITLLSFPYDIYSSRDLEMAKEAGYTKVFSGSLIFGSDDFLTGRVDVSTSDWKIEYWLKLRGAYNWVPLVRGIRFRLISIFK